MFLQLLKWIGFHVHYWSTWTVKERYDLFVKDKEVGKAIIQTRTCGDCGLEQYKKDFFVFKL